MKCSNCNDPMEYYHAGECFVCRKCNEARDIGMETYRYILNLIVIKGRSCIIGSVEREALTNLYIDLVHDFEPFFTIDYDPFVDGNDIRGEDRDVYIEYKGTHEFVHMNPAPPRNSDFM